MADSQFSELFRQFFSGGQQSMGVNGLGGGGWMVGRKEDKPLYRHFGVAGHVEGIFMEQWQQFQVMAPQLVPSSSAILLTMTLQSWQNALQKADQLTLDCRDTLCE